MIYPYLDLTRRGVVRRWPVIPIRLVGPEREADALGLVDSGAEHSVVSLMLFNYLGLRTDDATVVEIVGVGGKVSRGYLMEIEHQLGRHRWNAPVVFSDAVQSPKILGQIGFFEFFTVTFKRQQLLMDIRRAR